MVERCLVLLSLVWSVALCCAVFGVSDCVGAAFFSLSLPGVAWWWRVLLCCLGFCSFHCVVVAAAKATRRESRVLSFWFQLDRVCVCSFSLNVSVFCVHLYRHYGYMMGFAAFGVDV